MTRQWVVCAVGALVAALGLPAHAATPGWTLGAAPTPANTASLADGDIDCTSRTFCVQVGNGLAIVSGAVSHTSVPFAAVHSGAHVTVTALPVPIDADAPDPDAELGAVDCVTSSFCVAVGSYTSYRGGSRSLIETYAGGAWTAQAAPGPDGGLSEVACNASSCLAIGHYFGGVTENSYIDVRSAAGTWSNPPIDGQPYYFDVRDPVCPPTGRCTAQGYEYPGEGSSLQRAKLLYAGAAGWKGVYFPMPSGADEHTLVVGGMTCPSQQFCVGVGSYRDTATEQNHLVAERLINGKLSAREIPISAVDAARPQYLYATTTACGSVAAGTPCVAAATFGSFHGGHALLATFSGGHWQAHQARHPAGADTATLALNSVSCSGNGNCAAVGSVSEGTRTLGLAENWNGAHWHPTVLGPPAAARGGVSLDVVACAGGSCSASGSLAGFPTAGRPHHLLHARYG